ncbi:MAG: methylenetetrahydrofolate reductase [NAD(P)H] [Nocardioidaceae bacterium]|nr:methylenetetrahydrofolate reductase [NAD(P)H] [Nocardioidaceae bacterium]
MPLPAGPPTDVAPRDLAARIAADGPSFSFEFFPPKDDAGERQLWQTIRELEALSPTFVSVTYGAGGSTRDRTIRVTERIASDTTVVPVAHLTCVGHTREELRAIVGELAAAGVRNMLALRGDPPGGPGQPWVPHPGGLDHAVQLVELVRGLGDFTVGVAAFPDVHPEAVDAQADARALAAKAEAGAAFAVTQLFFRAEDYFALVERARALGCDIPVLPGIMPITHLAQIERFTQLSGAVVPGDIVSGLNRYADDPASVRAAGIEIATRLCDQLLDQGAPGLHYYTLNRSTATRRIHADLQTRIG